MPVPTYDQFIEPLLPSGAQPIDRNRAGWANDRLKRAELSSSPRRGSWQITQAGREFLECQPQPLAAEVARELAMGYGTSRSDLKRVGDAGDGGIDGVILLDRLGPEKVTVQAKRWQQATRPAMGCSSPPPATRPTRWSLPARWRAWC